MSIAINRLNDYVFKRIFGVPENKDILIDFLNSVILTDLTGPLTDLELDDREIGPEFHGDKASRLDILATAKSGAKINIEVQIVNIGGPESRTLFYWSRLYGRQLVSGVEYKALLPVIAVNVVNFEFLPDPDRFHQTFLSKTRRTQESLKAEIAESLGVAPATHRPRTLGESMGRYRAIARHSLHKSGPDTIVSDSARPRLFPVLRRRLVLDWRGRMPTCEK